MADRITDMSLETIMGERFGRYSKYIIQERALPDIRDGLKPVQRRILFAMNKDRNTYDHPYKKSAKAVGNVMGNFHPHGDLSIYEAMVRMSQDWKMRLPLIDMNGNNGSIDNDPPAAMRYTESRLAKVSNEILSDLEKNTVDMVLNFDDTEYEPTVLPSMLPNLFINGSTGISAGYATEIPPHNLNEITDALIYLLDHKNVTVEKLLDFVKGPDFPTGGIVQGIDGIKKAYTTGKGKVVLRSKVEITAQKAGKHHIEILEIPYGITKSTLVQKLDAVRLNKEIAGILDVRDESDRNGLSIVIEIAKDIDANAVLQYLYKKTDLQITYNFNMVAIDHKRPVNFSLLDGLSSFLEFRKEVILKRTAFDLKNAEDRKHIVEGLIKMVSILDQVIQTIRSSKNRKDAVNNLQTEFAFSDKQAEAIVTLQLYRLTNTDVTQLEMEFADLSEKIAKYHDILENEQSLKSVIRSELRWMKKTYGDERKTSIESDIEEIKLDKTITVADENVVVQITHNGYIKRSSLRSFKSTSDENGVNEDDYVILQQEASTLQHFYAFTNLGNFIYRPIHEITDSKWKDTGSHLSQELTNWDPNEKIISAFVIDEQSNEEVIFTTDNGYTKRTSFADMNIIRGYKKKSSLVIKLKDAAKLVAAKKVNASDEIVIITKQGKGLIFNADEVSIQGTKSVGVKAIDLASDDQVLYQSIVETNASQISLLTADGLFKYLPITEINKAGRATKGTNLYTAKGKVELVAAIILPVDYNDNLDLMVSGSVINIDIAKLLPSNKKDFGSEVIRKTILDNSDYVKLVKN